MFKKFKSKIEEELKQSPQRFTASVQQLAQVISNSTSGNAESRTEDGPSSFSNTLDVSSDLFSISDELDDPTKRMHTVDLTAASPPPMPSRSRRDSLSSIASDVSSLYPLHESQLNLSSLQGDFDSELDESTSSQLERVSKEKLYQGYKKLLYGYTKYKGRYMDLFKQHRDLQFEHRKTKSVLQESQDKALRRAEELREQCQLEQKAKAHLEESLRNDLEERDHKIETLETKIRLLKSQDKPTADLITIDGDDNSQDLEKGNRELLLEGEKLKKVTQSFHVVTNGPSLESTEQVKETITQLKSGIVRMKSENENISNLLSKSPSTSDAGSDIGSLVDLTSDEKLSNLLVKCRKKIRSLTAEVLEKEKSLSVLSDKLKKYEEDNNKHTIDAKETDLTKSIELKDQEISNLKSALSETKATAEDKWKKYQEDILKLKDEVAKATANRSECLEILKKDIKNNTHTRANSRDWAIFEKEKKIIEAEVEKHLKMQLDKLNGAVSVVSEKLSKAEGNLVRMCADKLISTRTTEMELQEKVAKLEIELADIVKKEAENYETIIAARDNIIDEKTKIIEELNVDLNANIDRIVVLGAELEEANGKHSMLLESYEEQCANINTLKSTMDNEIDNINEKYALLASQSEAISLENCKLKDNNNELTKVIDGHLAQIKSITEENEKLKSLFEEKEKLLLEHQQKIESLTLTIKESEEKIAMLNSNAHEKGQHLQEYNELKVKFDELVTEKQQLVTDLDTMHQRIEDLLKENSKCSVKIDQLTNEKTTLLEENKKLCEEIQEAAKLREEKDCISKALEEELKIHRKCKEELTISKENLLQEIDALRENLTEKETSLVSLRSELAGLQGLGLERVEIEKDLRKDLSDAKEKLEKEISIREEMSKELESNRCSLVEEKTELKKMKVELDAKIEELNKYKMEVTQKDREKGAIVAQFEGLLEEERKKLEKIAIELESSCGTMSKFDQSILDLKAQNNIALEKIGDENEKLKKRVEELSDAKEKLESELKRVTSSLENMSTSNADLVKNVSTMKELERKIEEVTTLCATKDKEITDLNVIKTELDIRYVELENKYKALGAENNEKLKSLMEELDAARIELDVKRDNAEAEAQKLREDSESKVNILKNEIKFQGEKFESEIANIEKNREREAMEMNSKLDHAQALATELLAKLEVAASEKEELLQQCNEKSLKVSELESCLTELKSDLDKNFNETSKISGSKFEEMYEEKLKKLVGDYEHQISNRDERIRELEFEITETSESLESLSTLRAELKNLRNELKEKDNYIEDLKKLRIENEDATLHQALESDRSLETASLKYQEEIAAQRQEWETKLKDEQLKWEHRLQEEHAKCEHSIKVITDKYDERLKVMQNEWANERKTAHSFESIPLDSPYDLVNSEELECTSKVAVAAVGSSTESIDMLRKEIMKQADQIKDLKKQHKREVLELGKLAALRARRMSEREGEDVEYEYLRNILYEYMMGREQMVLAKVLAAIVKFDQQQTHNILERQASANTLRIL